MKFSVNWLREFIDLPNNPEEIAELLTRAGVETKNIETRGAKVDKVIDETDQQRDQYVKTHYGRDRQDLTQYDVVLNAERLGFDGAADLIVAEIRRRGWMAPPTRRS